MLMGTRREKNGKDWKEYGWKVIRPFGKRIGARNGVEIVEDARDGFEEADGASPDGV